MKGRWPPRSHTPPGFKSVGGRLWCEPVKGVRRQNINTFILHFGYIIFLQMQERNIFKYENVEILTSFNRTCSLIRQSIARQSPSQINEKQPRYAKIGLMMPKKHWPFGNQIYIHTGWWFGTSIIFSIYRIILFQLTFIFFKMVIAPPTSIYIYIINIYILYYIIRLYQMWLWKNPEKPMKNPHL